MIKKPKKKTTKYKKKTSTSKSKTVKNNISPKKRNYANNLRRNMTLPEGMLWKRLKHNFASVEWYAQAIICGFIADFFCPEKRIVIEVDSSYHNDRKDYDKKRDEIMEKKGIKVLRFEAKDIMKNVAGILYKIKKEVEITKSNMWESKYY